MTKILWVVALCATAESLSAVAGDEVEVHLHQSGPGLDVDQIRLAEPGVKVTRSKGFEGGGSRTALMPSRKQRLKLLKQAGLAQDVTGWDELEQDLLVLRATNLKLEQLSRAYPKLSATRLKSLQSLVARTRAGGVNP